MSARLIRSMVWTATLVASTPSIGCVAMNIPSHRLDDPGDRGGLLGAWQTSPSSGESCNAGDGVAWYSGDIDNAFGGPLPEEVDHHGDPVVDSPAAVPWPRYHPIPTRPAFSSAGGVGDGPY